MNVDGTGVDVAAVFPDTLQISSPGHALAFIHQVAKELELLAGEAERWPARSTSARSKSTFDIAELILADRDAGFLSRAAKKGFDAGDQLGWIERLGEVIVAPSLRPTTRSTTWVLR